MAKIERKTQKIFANNAGSQQITAFGTAKLDNPTFTTDVDVIQNNNYLQGWDSSLESDLAPFKEDSTGLWYAITRQVAYLYQQGIAEWDAGTEYTQGSLVSKYNNGNLEIYMSLQNNNTGNQLTEDGYWKKYNLDDIIALINNKLNTNLDNLSTVSKQTITTFAMPSNRYTNIAWSSGATYTAPANGWYTVWGSFKEGGVTLYNTTTGLGNSTLNNSGAQNTGYASIQVKKGDAIRTYNAYSGFAVGGFRFIYAEGAQ